MLSEATPLETTPAQAKLVLHAGLLGLSQPLKLLMSNNPQGNADASHARRKGDAVRGAVALEAVVAGALAAGLDDAVVVKDGAVEQVEDVGRDDGCERHEAPILAQAADAKRLGDNRGEDAKEEAVGQAGEARHEEEEVWVGDVDGADLGYGEDEAGHHEAPDAGCAELLDEEVGADAWLC